MPHFKWQGINICGTVVRGRLFAWTPEQLDKQLFKRNIALLKSKPAPSRRFFARVCIGHKVGVFQQLHILVMAGVLLPDALAIIAEQTQHVILEEVMHTIALHVREGKEFSFVVRQYPLLCDSLMAQLVSVGETSGKLPIALEAVVMYLRAQQDFYTHISSALCMPGITLAFFMLVVSLIFTFIIPRFADMFASLGHDLPPLTKMLMEISDYMLSWSFVWMIGGVILGVFCISLFKKTAPGIKVWEKIVIKMPCVGTLVAYSLWGYFFESVGLLLAGGVQLVPALIAVQSTITHHRFYQTIGDVVGQVKHGNTFSCALQSLDSAYITPDVVAMIRVGQEVGALGIMLKQIAAVYHAKVKKTLSFITMIIQPLLIIMLGLLILLLIIAIYTPLLNMSYAV